MVVRRIDQGLFFGRCRRQAVARVGTADMRSDRAAHAVQIAIKKAEIILRLVIGIGRQIAGRAEQIPFGIPPDHALGEPRGGDMARIFRIARADTLRILAHRFPEGDDILFQLAGNHIAAVHPEIAETLRQRMRLQAGGKGLFIIGHHWAGRLFEMAVGVAEEDLAERDAVRLIAWGRSAGAEDHRTFFIIIRHGLRDAVGESEMFARNALLIRPQIERQAVDDLHLMRLQRGLDLLGPSLGAGLVLVVEQQQRVDGEGRDDLFLEVAGGGHRAQLAPLHALQRVALFGIGAPFRAALDHRFEPGAVAAIAEAAEPILLKHPFAERRGEGVERRRAQAHLFEPGIGKGKARRALVAAIGIGDGGDGAQRLEPRAAAVPLPHEFEKQRPPGRQRAETADHQPLGVCIMRRLQAPARRVVALRLVHRSLIHAAASFSLSDGSRRPLAMRLLRST